MNEVMGIITNTKGEEILEEIALQRCVSAVPFGGRYRLIDFPLSNMINSGINNIAIVVSYKFRALLDHIGSGKPWSLDRKKEGLVFLPEAKNNSIKLWGINFEDLYFNMDYLKRSKQKYVLITGSNMVCNIDYRKVLDFHKGKGSKLTIIYQEITGSEGGQLTWLTSNAEGRITNITKESKPPSSSKATLEMCLVERELLIEILEECSLGNVWNAADYFQKNINRFAMFSYPHRGYLGRIDSIQSFYKINMDLLEPQVWQEIFFNPGLIYTKTKDGPPAKYANTAQVRNTLVSSGAVLAGDLENCIIFRGVKISGGAVIKNSIIMQKSIIHEDSYLEHVILDKEVVVRKGTVLMGSREKPLVVNKKSVV